MLKRLRRNERGNVCPASPLCEDYDLVASCDRCRDRSHAAQPGAGNTAAINGSGALALFEDVPATVVGSTDQALGLPCASVGTLTMPHGLPQPPYAASASPTRYGSVFVVGQGSIGTIDLGAFADQDRFTTRGAAPFSPRTT